MALTTSRKHGQLVSRLTIPYRDTYPVCPASGTRAARTMAVAHTAVAQ